MTKKIPTIELVSEILKRTSMWVPASAIKARSGRSIDSVNEVLRDLEARGLVRRRQEATLSCANRVKNHYGAACEWQWVRP
jgi:RIO-like serine/threonine protein kinase